MATRPDTGTGRDTRAHVAAGHHTPATTTRGDLMRTTYTADEVHTLLYAAYTCGRYDADVNELHATWAEFDEPRATREQRVAARLEQMDTAARAQAEREGRPYRVYRGGPVDFETGAPVRHLEVAA